MAVADIIVDYLVVGAGVGGLSFVDELLTRTSTSTILIVDKRELPGGHWVDSYPYVKLHQPANQYGVESKELSNGRFNDHGRNKGLSDLASRPEIQAYCHTLVRDRFIPSGRVTFLPSTEFLSDGTLRGPSGKVLTVEIKKKLVDASYLTNVIPLSHTRSFSVNDVPCIPPNNLPNAAKDHANFTILGAGKTALDACLWLLEQDINPTRIRWIIPADYWYFNRLMFEGTPESFPTFVRCSTGLFQSIATASNASDVAIRYEASGVFLRLDSSIEPKQFHAASLSIRDAEELRRIQDIVRKGHVTKIEGHQITLTHGKVEAKPNTVYIDCTARCFPDKPSVPVFQPGKIVLQLIRHPLMPFSCAKIAFLESLTMQDEEKNTFATPIRFTKNLDGYILSLGIELENRARENQHPVLRRWLAQSRLDHYTRMADVVKPEDAETLATLESMQASFIAAYSNISKVIASLESGPAY